MTRNQQAVIALIVLAAIGAVVYYWRVIVQQTPGDYEVRKGNYRLEDGRFEQAVEEFSKALEENPDHERAHLGLAIAYMQMGKLDKALAAFDRTIELAPEMAVAYADRGIVRDRMGRYEEAVADYRKALELNPDLGKGPGWLWRFLRNVSEKPPTIRDRLEYLEAELRNPPGERLLRVPEVDSKQRMYKK
ncbi:MAG: tetratricopeptide repeat protein [Nitrospirota bacterium]|jgi:tetratricopeptide (TPR) repeat protein